MLDQVDLFRRQWADTMQSADDDGALLRPYLNLNDILFTFQIGNQRSYILKLDMGNPLDGMLLNFLRSVKLVTEAEIIKKPCKMKLLEAEPIEREKNRLIRNSRVPQQKPNLASTVSQSQLVGLLHSTVPTHCGIQSGGDLGPHQRDKIYLTIGEQEKESREITKRLVHRHLFEIKELCSGNRSGDSTSTSIVSRLGSSNATSADSLTKALLQLEAYPVYHVNCGFCIDDENLLTVEQGLYGYGNHPKLGGYIYAKKLLGDGTVLVHEDPLIVLPGDVGESNIFCVNCYKEIDLLGKKKLGLPCSVRICERCSAPLCAFAKCDPLVLCHTSSQCDYFRARGIVWEFHKPFNYEELWRSLWKFYLYDNPKKMQEINRMKFFGSQFRLSFSEAYEDTGEIPSLCGMDVDKETMKTHKKQWQENTFYYRAEYNYETKYASILYHEIQKFNHSCVPNLSYTNSPAFHGTLTASRKILPGEMLTFCYDTNLLLEPTSHRRKSLYKHYNFWCTCRRCNDPSELGTYFDCLLCFHCNKGKFYLGYAEGYLHKIDQRASSGYVCDTCGYIYAADEIQCHLEILEAMIDMNANSYQKLAHLMTKWFDDKDLHESHRLAFIGSVHVITGILDDFGPDLNIFLQSDNFLGFIRFADIIIHIYRTFIPGTYDFQGLVLFAASLIRFAGMAKEECEDVTVEDVMKELKLCFLRRNNHGILKYSPMLIHVHDTVDKMERGCFRALRIVVTNLMNQLKSGKYGKLKDDDIEIMKILTEGI